LGRIILEKNKKKGEINVFGAKKKICIFLYETWTKRHFLLTPRINTPKCKFLFILSTKWPFFYMGFWHVFKKISETKKVSKNRSSGNNCERIILKNKNISEINNFKSKKKLCKFYIL